MNWSLLWLGIPAFVIVLACWSSWEEKRDMERWLAQGRESRLQHEREIAEYKRLKDERDRKRAMSK